MFYSRLSSKILVKNSTNIGAGVVIPTLRRNVSFVAGGKRRLSDSIVGTKAASGISQTQFVWLDESANGGITAMYVSAESLKKTSDAFIQLDSTGKHFGVIAKTCGKSECVSINCSSNVGDKNFECLVNNLSDEEKAVVLKYSLTGNLTSKPPQNTESFQLNSQRNYVGAQKAQRVVLAKNLKFVDISCIEKNLQATSFVQETEHHQKLVNTPNSNGVTVADKLKKSFKNEE